MSIKTAPFRIAETVPNLLMMSRPFVTLSELAEAKVPEGGEGDSTTAATAAVLLIG
jgi:hypothetical protein